MKASRGIATLEILIAFAVLALVLTAIISVSFGTESISIDTQTNSEALAIARSQLENARAAGKQDFYSLAPTSSAQKLGPITYSAAVSYKDVAPFVKQATTTVTWLESGRTLKTIL